MQKRLLMFGFFAFSLGALVAILPVAYAARATTTITVTTTADTLSDDGFCSLREAVRAANLDAASGSTPGECPPGSGEDLIILPAGTYTLTLSGQGENASLSGDLDLTSTLTLHGAGSDLTIIDGGGIDRHFHLIGDSDPPVNTVVMSGMTLRNGDPGPRLGGAIRNDFTKLNLTDLVIHGNRADSGGGMYVVGSLAELTLLNSTIYSNTARLGDGGAIFNNTGNLTILHSTLMSNQAEVNGGGVRNAGGVIQIVNSTLSGNTTKAHGGAIHTNNIVDLSNATLTGNQSDADSNGNGTGGGIFIAGSGDVTLKNSILAANSDPDPDEADCSGPLISLGYNLFGSDLGACTVVLAPGDITTTTPALGPLQDNGGATFTHALLPGSPAIDAGSPADPGSDGEACELTDQRSYARPADGDGDNSALCDIGAYELGAMPGHFVYLPIITRNP